jgi:hypothetical protein
MIPTSEGDCSHLIRGELKIKNPHSRQSGQKWGTRFFSNSARFTVRVGQCGF